MRKTLAVFVIGACLAMVACGTSINPDFPNRLVGADGQSLVLDDLAAIANDPTLTADEKRQAIRDLGIEDEELIDALLDL